MTKRFWRIRGYSRSKKILDERIPVGCMTERQLQELLKCLMAKEGLDYREIVGAYAKRKDTFNNNRYDGVGGRGLMV